MKFFSKALAVFLLLVFSYYLGFPLSDPSCSGSALVEFFFYVPDVQRGGSCKGSKAAATGCRSTAESVLGLGFILLSLALLSVKVQIALLILMHLLSALSPFILQRVAPSLVASVSPRARIVAKSTFDFIILTLSVLHGCLVDVMEWIVCGLDIPASWLYEHCVIPVEHAAHKEIRYAAPDPVGKFVDTYAARGFSAALLVLVNPEREQMVSRITTLEADNSYFRGLAGKGEALLQLQLSEIKIASQNASSALAKTTSERNELRTTVMDQRWEIHKLRCELKKIEGQKRELSIDLSSWKASDGYKTGEIARLGGEVKALKTRASELETLVALGPGIPLMGAAPIEALGFAIAQVPPLVKQVVVEDVVMEDACPLEPVIAPPADVVPSACDTRITMGAPPTFAVDFPAEVATPIPEVAVVQPGAPIFPPLTAPTLAVVPSAGIASSSVNLPASFDGLDLAAAAAPPAVGVTVAPRFVPGILPPHVVAPVSSFVTGLPQHVAAPGPSFVAAHLPPAIAAPAPSIPSLGSHVAIASAPSSSRAPMASIKKRNKGKAVARNGGSVAQTSLKDRDPRLGWAEEPGSRANLAARIERLWRSGALSEEQLEALFAKLGGWSVEDIGDSVQVGGPVRQCRFTIRQMVEQAEEHSILKVRRWFWNLPEEIQALSDL